MAKAEGPRAELGPGLHQLDPDDAQLDVFARRDPATVIIEGELAVLRLLEAGHQPSRIVATRAHGERLVAAGGSSVHVATHGQLRAITGFDFHRGVVASIDRAALTRALDGAALDALASRAVATIVVLVGLADPANVGTIIRSARAFGADLIICDRKGADPWGRKAIRAAAGQGFGMRVWADADIDDVLRALAERSLQTVACTPSADAVPLRSFVPPPRVAFVFGNEGQGLDPERMASATARVAVEMQPGVDSLNVAGCAAIVLWQRFSTQPGSSAGNETASSTNS